MASLSVLLLQAPARWGLSVQDFHSSQCKSFIQANMLLLLVALAKLDWLMVIICPLTGMLQCSESGGMYIILVS